MENPSQATPREIAARSKADALPRGALRSMLLAASSGGGAASRWAARAPARSRLSLRRGRGPRPRDAKVWRRVWPVGAGRGPLTRLPAPRLLGGASRLPASVPRPAPGGPWAVFRAASAPRGPFPLPGARAPRQRRPVARVRGGPPGPALRGGCRARPAVRRGFARRPGRASGPGSAPPPSGGLRAPSRGVALAVLRGSAVPRRPAPGPPLRAGAAEPPPPAPSGGRPRSSRAGPCARRPP